MNAMPAYQSASIGALQMPWFASTARVRQSKLRCQFPAYADVHCYSTDFKIRCLGSLHQLGFCVPPSHATFADNNGITPPNQPPYTIPKLNAPSQVLQGIPAPPPTTATSTPAPSPNAPPPPSPRPHLQTPPTAQQPTAHRSQPPQPSTPLKAGPTAAATPTP